MPDLYNIYCDESCHLENDKMEIMAFGAIWCPLAHADRLSKKVMETKLKHNAKGELKWNKVTKTRLEFYIELINWFVEEEEIHFRALVVRDKCKLNHDAYNLGSHDTFYYKMYYSLINKIMDPTNRYNIYLDIKDTQSEKRIIKLKEVLCNNFYDFTGELIQKIQQIRSSESNLLQLGDFLLGAVSYQNRNLDSSQTKRQLIDYLERKINKSLRYSTSLKEDKFNLFHFSPR